MKGMRKLLIVLVIAVVLFAGCSSDNMTADYETGTTSSMNSPKSEDKSSDMAVEESAESAPMDATGSNASASDPVGGADLSNRKIIETRNIFMQTETFDTTVQKIEDLVYVSFGYIQHSNVEGKSFYDQNQRVPRMASYTLRVPAENYVAFVDELISYGYIIDNNVAIRDVTNEYMDIEARVATLEIREASLRKLLENSDDLETILTLEKELADVRYEIERYISSLNNLDNLVDYSTVYLDIEEVFEYIEMPEAPPKTYGEKVTSGFTGTLEDIGRFFQNLSIWLIVNSPYLIIWLVIILVIVTFVKKVVFKSTSKIKKQPTSEVEHKEQDK